MDNQALQQDTPSRRPRLTLYHILVIGCASIFGVSKAALSYNGQSTAPTTLDWLYGVILFLFFYWMGIYEKHADHDMPWLFEQDRLTWLWDGIDLVKATVRRDPGYFGQVREIDAFQISAKSMK